MVETNLAAEQATTYPTALGDPELAPVTDSKVESTPEPKVAAEAAVPAPVSSKGGPSGSSKRAAPIGDEENASARPRPQSRPESQGLRPRGGSTSKPRLGLAAAAATVWP